MHNVYRIGGVIFISNANRNPTTVGFQTQPIILKPLMPAAIAGRAARDRAELYVGQVGLAGSGSGGQGAPTGSAPQASGAAPLARNDAAHCFS